MRFFIKFLILLSLFACSTSPQRKVASTEIGGRYQLSEGITLRAEDENGNLEVVHRLSQNDLIIIRLENQTGPQYYINDGDIVQSNSGWFHSIVIERSENLTSQDLIELNQRKLYLSENVLNRSIRLNESDLGLDCGLVEKGCLLKRDSDEVIIFFRGWVPDNRFGSQRSVPIRHWQTSAFQMLTDPRQIGSHIEQSLAELNLQASIFTVGSSDQGLTVDEMDRILEEAGASKLIFASHSGGWRGLQYTITPPPKEYWEKVKAIWMLDNFYSTGLAEDLERNFGLEFLNQHCFAFVTPHRENRQINRFNNHFRELCPQVLDSGIGHSNGVVRCMPQFERGEPCSP